MMTSLGRWTTGLILAGLLVLPAGQARLMAQAGDPPRQQLEDVLYQDLLDNLAADAAAQTTTAAEVSAPAASPAAPRKAALTKTSATMRCLPSCSTTDGRFLAIAGSNLATLSGSDLNLQISVPAAATSFTVGIFDGDARGVDSAGISHWDTGVTNAVYEYTLYADPAADGAGTTVVEMVPGNPVLTGSIMPDNAWIDFTIPTNSVARTPSGNFFYHLKISLTTPTMTSLNAFKVRTDSVITGLTLDPVARPFSYISNPTNTSDLRILYPSFPAASPTTYDGTFTFYFDVPTSQPSLTVWDGDFDRGKFDGTDLDTDDPDTPNAPFRPAWATVDTVPEGVAVGLPGTTGNPPDDRNPAGSGIYSLRSPSIRYDVIFPDGQTFANENPSGNLEWEQFKISTDPFDRSQMDYHTSVIPPGTYQMRIQGVDLVNLNAVLLPSKVVCIDDLGIPCTLLRPFALGDTVFVDSDANHVQGPGEPGIPGVVLELRDTAGFLLRTTTTDADGHYRFEVDAGSYQVVVAASNFDAGGPLSGYIATIANQITDTVTNDNVLTYDFGFRGTASVGDRLWLDLNANGAQDTGEPGLNGVTVQLFDGSGNVLATTVTSGDGNYSFDHLAPATYSVRVDASTLPAGLAPTYDLDGTATANTAAVTLAASAHRTDVDFGYRGTGSIGDRLWYDLNGNGTQDSGEAGLNGVTVRLLDSGGNTVATATTGGDGNYSFNNLPAGTFTVTVDATTLPAGTVPTFDLDGTGTANAATVSLAAGAARTDVDFGYRGTASLGDRVWYDVDGDGVQDTGETGLNGVTVQLLDTHGTVIATATTAGDGNYTFSNLLAGTYTVRIATATLPAGAVETFDADGTATADAATVTLNGGQSLTTVDFGYRGTASLGDRVWYDLNGDGVQDPNETGLNGVTVQLLDGAGNTIASTVTSGNGGYTFPGLLAGTYTVHVVASTLPAGPSPTFDADGTATPDTATVSLTSGQNRTDVDFGYRGTAAIGDRVWYDLNGNGTQEPEEVGINGVTVELLDGAGNFMSSTVTSGNGGYSFAGLFAGTYTVRTVATTLPGGAVETFDLDGTGTANTATVTLAAGQNLTTADFGYRGTASLGDRVWLDLNNNGAQDSGEAGINGVAVELLDSAGNVLTSSSTAGDGIYGFANLLAGSYTVRVVTATLPAGMVETFDADGTATANTASATLAAGASRTDVDFGYRGVQQFGDRVWFDYDGNGIQDTGEPGITGVVITLKNSAGTPIATTTTGTNGNYTFTNLPAGTYSVVIVPSSLPGGAVPTYDLDGTATPNVTTVTLAAGQSRTDVDFGYRGNGSLGDRVWLDYNANGVQDAGEIGINGVTVQLLDSSSNSLIATATTAGDGNYTFPNLLPGTYKVSVVTSTLMSGATQTYDLDGTATANTASVSLSAGQNRTDADFGYRVAAPGTGTIGYWKTHASAWPVASITIGGVVYTRDQAITILNTPPRGDESIVLFVQLLAAKLNLITGNNPSCIYSTVNSSDAWTAAHPPGSGVSGSSAAWTTASPWQTQLNNYNNGLLCAPHRN
ncbi:MAG TPA: SdrD B-like domain-containing protein [Thermoanaerobaculia bacterium]|nr:SdrD B-like domain-containing protein [Thermoanaerobaculia bacterium]